MRRAAIFLATSLLAAGAHAATPTYGTFGFDTAGMDRSIKPGDNFYGYANGAWQKNTVIPADRSSWGMFTVLRERSLERTRGILEAAAAKPGSKIGDFYASFMDEQAVDAKGAAPIKPWLDRIAAAKDKPALAAIMAELQRQGVDGLFGAGVGQDDKHPEIYIASFGQDGLGLPDRDYYLKDDPKLVAIRTAYPPYIAKLMTLAGIPDAARRAAAVMAMETSIAQGSWSRIDSRDADKTYNRWSAADFAAKAPGFDWQLYLAGLGFAGQDAFLVAQPSAFAAEAKAWADTPLATLKDFEATRVLTGYARYLSKPFVDTNFAFVGTTLTGTPENQARWKRGVTLVSSQMGEAVGQDYVARYFPPAAKAAADQLVRNIIASYRERLAQVPWMATATRQQALAKLASFTPKIGYPDKWRDYSKLTVVRGDLVGNVARGEAFEWQRNLDKLGKPLDRSEWHMDPMTVNAYANPTMNEIVFPAAILQAPFFDPAADPAVNYGGIGVVIGHELSHHFDDQGRKYDKTGALTDWWTPQDVQRFTGYTDALVKQYDAYEPIPGQHIQGGLTLGENMADLAGLTVSRQAYQISLGGKPAPVLGGFTGDQRFFLGYAQIWRTKYREPALRQQLLTDPHSPGEWRTDEVRNQNAWYPAFDVKPGQTLYLAPDARVHVW